MSDGIGSTLGEKADDAFRRTATKVIERARQTGTPVKLWENGQVVERFYEEGEELDAQGSPRQSETHVDQNQRQN
jgi:hypothetical protein